jgi:hypothetical protein
MTMKTRATILALPLQLLFVMACGEKGPATGAAGPADPGTQPQVTAPAPSAELREKLRTLAVAAECLRRSDAPNEVVSRAMMDLYAEHGIDLDTYAREMGRLGGDASFQAEIQAGLSSCPTPPVAVGDPAAADPATEADAGATGADPGSVIAAAAPDAEGAGGVGVEPALDPEEGGPDGSSAEPGGAGEEAALLQPPETDPTDAAVPAPADDPLAAGPEGSPAEADPATPDVDIAEPGQADPETPDTPDAPDFGGTWTGALRGTTSGTLRLVVQGTSLSSAALNIGGRSVRLQGTLTATGKLALGGRLKAGEFIRMRGTVSRDHTRMTGSWDGVIERKMVKGSFSLTR